jgi:hypothetical protein
METVTKWLADYFADARTLMTADELSSEFASLGGRAGWPKATKEHWMREINAAIERGEVYADASGYVKPKQPQSVKQLSLFGD